MSIKIIIALLLIELVGLGVLIRSMLKKRGNTPAICLSKKWYLNPFILIALGYVVVVIITSVVGVNPTESIWGTLLRGNGVWVVAHLVMVGLLLPFVLHTREQWIRVMRFSLIVATVLSVMNIIGVHVVGFFPDVLTAHFGVTIGNPIFYTGYLLMHLVLLGISGVHIPTSQTTSVSKNKQLWWYGAHGVVGVLIVYSLLLSSSRAAILGLILGVVAMGVVLIWHRMRLRRVEQMELTRGTKISIWIGVLVVLLYVVVQFIPQTIVQLPRGVRLDFQATTSQTRLVFWQSAWEGIVERPFTGWGKAAYPHIFAKYFDPTIDQVALTDIFIDDAHNFYLTAFVESGLIGALLYLALFGVLVWFGLRKLRAVDRPMHTDWQWVILIGGIIAYGVYGIFSIEHISVHLFFWILYGWAFSHTLTRSSERSTKIGLRNTRRIGLQVIGVLVLLVAVGYTSLVAHQLYGHRQARLAIDGRQWFSWQEDINQNQKTISYGYGCDWWSRQLFTWLQASESGTISADLQMQVARELLEDSQRCTRDYTIFTRTYLLGQMYENLGEIAHPDWYALAFDAYKHAEQLSPNHLYVSYALASTYASVGDVDSGIALLEKRIEEFPSIARTYWFLGMLYSLSGDEQRAQELEQQAKDLGLRILIEARK